MTAPHHLTPENIEIETSLSRKRFAILEIMLDRLRSGGTRWEILSRTLPESLRIQPLFLNEVNTLWEIFDDAILLLEDEWWRTWWRRWGYEEE